MDRAAKLERATGAIEPDRQGVAMNQPKEKTDERERWEGNCLAKAAFCAFSASITPDNAYRDYLSALAVEWKKAAKAMPGEPGADRD